MKPVLPARPCRGLTLIELLVALAVVGVIATMAAPSFREFIATQRLKSVQAQLVTDLQFARSLAVSQGAGSKVADAWQSVMLVVQPAAQAGAMSCYTIYTDTQNRTNACDCRLSGTLRCPDAARTTELRTVQLPPSQRVQFTVPGGSTGVFEFGPITGGPSATFNIATGVSTYASAAVETSIDDNRKFRTVLAPTGRPQACVPSGSKLEGTAC